MWNEVWLVVFLFVVDFFPPLGNAGLGWQMACCGTGMRLEAARLCWAACEASAPPGPLAFLKAEDVAWDSQLVMGQVQCWPCSWGWNSRSLPARCTSHWVCLQGPPWFAAAQTIELSSLIAFFFFWGGEQGWRGGILSWCCLKSTESVQINHSLEQQHLLWGTCTQERSWHPAAAALHR